MSCASGFGPCPTADSSGTEATHKAASTESAHGTPGVGWDPDGTAPLGTGHRPSPPGAREGRIVVVKRASVIRHLLELAEQADAGLRLRDTEIGWPLEELWIAGDLLDNVQHVEDASMILMLDEPAEELTWLALHPSGEWIGDQLRLGKRPLRWAYRPVVYPAWNPRDRRVLRIWRAGNGLDEQAIEDLRRDRFDRLAISEPSDEGFEDQLRVEWADCRHHLRRVLDSYWDRDWRQDHKGFGTYPEHHLWRAAEAVREVEDALARLRP